MWRDLANRGVAAVQALPTLAIDTFIALGCYLAAIAGPNSHDGDITSYSLASLASLPLVWRRRSPLLVLIVTGLATIAITRLGMVHEVPYGQLVATYTVASLSGPIVRAVAIAGTVAGIAFALAEKTNVLPIGSTILIFGGAYALGAIARSRRGLIETLEARARTLAADYAEAASRERERIARDMHDILAHSVNLMVVQAEAGPVVVRSNPARAVTIFDAIADAGRDALTQLRRTLGVLRSEPASRTPQPGLDGLESLVAQARGTGMPTTLTERGHRRPIAPDVAVAVYRVVQESLTNAVKHAHASRIDVRLRWEEDGLDLEIRDDGRGRGGRGGPGRMPSGGHGLIGMRERVAACGGTLSAGPADDGNGFRVAARLPLTEQAATAANVDG